jgi:hypothetical protein
VEGNLLEYLVRSARHGPSLDRNTLNQPETRQVHGEHSVQAALGYRTQSRGERVEENDRKFVLQFFAAFPAGNGQCKKFNLLGWLLAHLNKECQAPQSGHLCYQMGIYENCSPC